ncbi:MAG: TetR/AcrR family transcriptional regulator [Novosphingobium sp.]
MVKRKVREVTARMRQRIIEAAAALMREGGYNAVTAGKLAEAVGLSRQSIHYHFGTIDELLIEVMRFGLEVGLAELEEGLRSDEPLRVLWRLITDASRKVAVFEFRAAALRSPAIREEITQLYDRLRDMQIKVIERHFALRGIEPTMPPSAAALLIPALMQEIAFERAMGVTRGHDEILSFFDKWIAGFAAVSPELA